MDSLRDARDATTDDIADWTTPRRQSEVPKQSACDEGSELALSLLQYLENPRPRSLGMELPEGR